MDYLYSVSDKLESYLPITEQDKDEITNAKGIYKVCLAMQKCFSIARILPQYKYFSRPVYKLIVSRSNPIVATAATFFITDLVMHQFLQGTVIKCAISSGQDCGFSYCPYTGAVWMALSIPVMVVKYQKSTTIFRK
jgi:hypothetical protein